MLDSARRKILQDMGIDVWLLRAAAGRSGGPAEPLKATRQAAQAANAAQASTALQEPAGEGRQPRNRAKAAAVPAFSGEIDTPAVESLVVESLALPGVVVLLPALNSRRDVRLAGDLVAAAARNWTQPPQRRRFSSPPDTPSTAGKDQASAVARALRAFVDKDLQDHGARVVVYVGSVAERLPEVWPGVQVLKLSDLGAFSRDPQAKKSLWAELCVPGM